MDDQGVQSQGRNIYKFALYERSKWLLNHRIKVLYKLNIVNIKK